MSLPLVANRMAHTPAGGDDQLVLLHVCNELQVAIPDGLTAERIQTGEGMGPADQDQKSSSRGGCLSARAIGNRAWPETPSERTRENRAGTYLRRLRGLPNETGLAWYPALLWQVGGAAARQGADGQWRQRRAIWRVPLVDEAYLVRVGTPAQVKLSGWTSDRAWDAAAVLAALAAATREAAGTPDAPAEPHDTALALARARRDQEENVVRSGVDTTHGPHLGNPFCGGTACRGECYVPPSPRSTRRPRKPKAAPAARTGTRA